MLKNQIALAWCLSLHAQVTVDNRSEHPFNISSITYKYYDGLEHKPRIELARRIIPAKDRSELGPRGSESIIGLRGTLADKPFSFDLTDQSIIMIRPDNSITLLGPDAEKIDHNQTEKMDRRSGIRMF